MSTDVTLGVGAILALGIASQWLGRALAFPSILILLVAGILAGPVTGIVEPDEIFGEALFPLVSLGVGLLLFEEGLKLRFDRLPPGTRHPVWRLLTIGVAITAVGVALAAAWIFDLTTGEALVLGAILTVSGPTVVGPALRVARPREPAGSILTFEGTFLDPVGAVLSVTVLNVVLREGSAQGWTTILAGLAIGIAAAFLLVAALRLLVVPDDLEVAVAVALAAAAFTAGEELREEAGLFATTAMGVALANQRIVTVSRVAEFGRTLGPLILGSLFIVLAARVDLDEVADLLPEILLLLAAIVILIRPLATLASLLWTNRPRAERALIASIAPRGVVAAATSSLFAIKFSQAGTPFPELVPVTFGIIFGTALVYGLGAAPVTALLGLRKPIPRGLAILGERPWVLDLARAVHETGAPVVVLAGRELDSPSEGAPVFVGPLDQPGAREALGSVGRALVATEMIDRRLLAGEVLVDQLGRRGVRVMGHEGEDTHHPDLLPRVRTGIVRHSEEIEEPYERGARFAVLDRLPDGVRPLLFVDADGQVHLHRRPRGAGVRAVALVGGDARGEPTTYPHAPEPPAPELHG